MTAFTLLKLLVVNDSWPRDYLNWAQKLGANTFRVFGMWGLEDFDPRDYGGRYYEELDTVASVLEERGAYLHYVAFTDQVSDSRVLMSAAEQEVHLRRSIEVLREHPNGLLEINNEDWKNGGISARFPASWFEGILTTRSSWPDGENPLSVGSYLDYTTEHTPRDAQWARKSKNLLETARTEFASGRPAIGGEPIAIFEQDIPGSRASNPRLFADYFAGAELFGAGACLHGDGSTLQRCQIPGPQAQRCAEAVSAIWRDVVPRDAASLGDYTRGGLGNCPLAHRDRYDENGRETDSAGALRTFAMLQGARATALVVDPGPSHRIEPVQGWRLVEQRGPQGQVVLLER